MEEEALIYTYAVMSTLTVSMTRSWEVMGKEGELKGSISVNVAHLFTLAIRLAGQDSVTGKS